MYSTCLFCNSSLGNNEVVEAFPVGRRLAFDPAKGRLWVVCRRCARWNLTPLEERWEAFEECERLFRGTRTRFSTDQIGLARLTEGLELVRIGEPLRPEFAAWRYGDQFGKRRLRNVAVVGAAVGGVMVLQAGLFIATPVLIGAGWAFTALQEIPVKARIRLSDGRILKLRNRHTIFAGIGRSVDDGGMVVRLPYGGRTEMLTGQAGEHAARVILAINNAMLGSGSVVRKAVREMEDAGSPERYLRNFSPRNILPASRKSSSGVRVSRVPNMYPGTRLALEMALHEEHERRALEGELAELENAWREAEEIAAITDDLLVPAAHRKFIETHRVKPSEARGEEP
jgi:hypothetical protein